MKTRVVSLDGQIRDGIMQGPKAMHLLHSLRRQSPARDISDPAQRRMHELPAGLVAYRRSPEFNQDTLPAALQREHSTKAGAWALIHVVEGKLLYRILEPRSERILQAGEAGVVEPEQLHEVQSIGPVRLFVEFFRAVT